LLAQSELIKKGFSKEPVSPNEIKANEEPVVVNSVGFDDFLIILTLFTGIETLFIGISIFFVSLKLESLYVKLEIRNEKSLGKFVEKFCNFSKVSFSLYVVSSFSHFKVSEFHKTSLKLKFGVKS
jgi:hypothetical protein